jgi:hypothetical protein
MRRSISHLAVAGAIVLTVCVDVSTPGQEAKKVAPVEKAAAPADDADQFVKQWEQRFEPQFRQMLRGELHFLRLTTNLTRPQFEKIAADSDPLVKAAIRKYALAMRQGGEQSDPQSPLIEAIAKSVAADLSPEQSARYRKELDARTAARKQLAVLNLVAMTDKLLFLSSEQREKLSEILTNNWDDSWNQIQLYMYYGQYFPRMPDNKINPILTELQRKVWSGVQKNQVRFGVNLGLARGDAVDEAIWDDDPLEKKPAKPDDRPASPVGAVPKPPTKP